MQWQFMRSRFAAPGQPVAAVALSALCAVALCTTEAGAQLTVGGVNIDVGGRAGTVLSAVRAAKRAASKSPASKPPSSKGPATSSKASARSAARVLPTAERYLGVRYRWGGTSPKTGFDCSGFVQYVFAKHGTRLPRTSRQQATSGRRLSPKWATLQPGDLVMFAEPGRRISHVAIYAGRGRIIHATGSGRKVRYDALDTKRGKWYAKHLVAARRVTTGGAAIVRDLLAQQKHEAVPMRDLDAPDRAPAPTGSDARSMDP